ncbi:DUF2894 domain-containing protein [Bordetella holmesii]|nr:hypothetical protein D558_0875 [Bordetella holmesii 44057]AMD44721.1 hypothetical protein H558_03960 [Bordetella holmesii H558]AMD49807.1 membrane protein [Bordetella holmesii F627]AOB36819.1 hypothetical protein BBB42_15760 [Bordetella holmesii]AUL20783.1 hypothetical protein BTL46_15895 [Bordetella holmesii]
MNDELDAGLDAPAPAWAVFGDLMSVLLGAFVLILVGIIGFQLQLTTKLDEEVKERQAETQRRETLEQALAGPLAAGRVTLVDGRIGISGSVLFALNSDHLVHRALSHLRSLSPDYLHQFMAYVDTLCGLERLNTALPSPAKTSPGKPAKRRAGRASSNP